ncbi:acyl-CoA dehydrogenase family protein (plasmid) [Methylobacterium sp. NMS12]|uniref:acyl-CoA dehydrogenase family protein n=1 Tax=Methylobacterium sp. NMS12 TaxID=3079766 RepID=UPI003F884304
MARGSARREADNQRPHDVVRTLLAAGFGALLVPAKFGGAGLGYRELFALVVRLSAADANVAHIFRNHHSFIAGLLTHPDRDVSDHWLARAGAGELFANGNTDRVGPRDTTGRADFGSTTTLLSRIGDRHELNGVKNYSTGSLYADWLVIFAKDAESDATSNVIVPARQNGVAVVDDWRGFGQKSTASGTVTLDHVVIDHPAQILPRNRLRAGQEYGATVAQLFLTAVIAGIVRASFDAALDLITTRKQNLYFAPTVDPTEDPLLQHSLGRLSATAFAAEAIILRAAEDLDRTAALTAEARAAAAHEHALSAAKAKVIIDQLGTEAATLLFEIGGASATHIDRQLDRHWRNARTIASHNPSAYKARAIGAYLARGEELPKLGFF